MIYVLQRSLLLNVLSLVHDHDKQAMAKTESLDASLRHLQIGIR